MTYKPYIKFTKFFWLALCSCTGISLFPLVATSQSFKVKPRYHEGKYYLAAEDYGSRNSGYFALDMETARQLPDTGFARKLYQFQAGTDLPMKDFITGSTKSNQSYKEIKCRDVKAFDRILDRDKGLLKEKKKEDKKNNIINQYYVPSELVVFHEASEHYYLFSTYGIYSVHQDSLQMPAKTAIEYTGFRFLGLTSAKFFNPNAFILEFTLGIDKRFYKVFDMQTGAFNNIPGLDEMKDIKCLGSRTSPYVIFYGNSTDTKDFHQRTVLFNYETQQVESNIRYSTPDVKYKTTLYLHKNLLYCNFEYFSMGWQHGLVVTDLKNNAKQVFNYKQKL